MKAETLIGRTPNLRPPSPTVVRLLNLLDNPNADYDAVIATVSRDPVLSAKILALCNSASYGLAQPVASLEHAVLYLGYGEIHRLVMGLSFGSQVGVQLPGYDIEAGALWRHSLAVALLSPRVLAVSKQISADTSVAYTAGLLHDIGKLVIGQALDAKERARIRELVETRESSLLEAEKLVIGCNHAEVGACLLRRWHIPEVIIEVAANHHQPPPGSPPALSTAIHIADAIAHQTGASPGWESFAVTRHKSALTALALSSAELDALTIAAVDCLEQAARHERIAAPSKSVPPSENIVKCAF